MAKCSNCGKPIKYNQYKEYRGKILCYDCYDTRLERKKAKKEAAKRLLEAEEDKASKYAPVPEEENNSDDNGSNLFYKEDPEE